MAVAPSIIYAAIIGHPAAVLATCWPGGVLSITGGVDARADGNGVSAVLTDGDCVGRGVPVTRGVVEGATDVEIDGGDDTTGGVGSRTAPGIVVTVAAGVAPGISPNST
jgi:hypothetical protein